MASPNDPEGLHVVYAPDDGEASVEYVNILQRLVTENKKMIHQKTNVRVSIVAIHGLGGHPHDTWTHDNGIMWLRDLLPLDMSDARIMTWEYDSEYQTLRHFTRMMMYSHPNSLLSALYSLRQDTKSNNRPIIFMCHSLGGLVVKEALVQASMAIPKYDKHLRTIRICTKGIIFFGTPHQSTQETSFGKAIGHLFSIAQSRGKPLTSLASRERPLTSLATVCDTLELQMGQFKSICTDLSIYYCYERRPTRNPLGVDFVSKGQNASCCKANVK